MAFRFSLQTVLRLRQIAEQREERVMEDILRKMAQQRQHLSDLAKLKHSLVAQCEIMLRRKTSAAAMTLLQGQIQTLKDSEIEEGHQLDRLEGERQVQLKVYEAAHRDLELLSRIREQQVDHFKRLETRKEQMQMDDVFSSRRKSVP
jgi:flagellar export protein FliJ